MMNTAQVAGIRPINTSAGNPKDTPIGIKATAVAAGLYNTIEVTNNIAPKSIGYCINV